MIYVTIDELAEMVAQTMCLTCQKQMYTLMTEHMRKHAKRNLEPLPKQNSLSELQRTFIEVCRELAVPEDLLHTKNNKSEIIYAKRVFARRASALGYSASQIGRFLGFHHSSILHLLKTEGIIRKSTTYHGAPVRAQGPESMPVPHQSPES